MPEPVSDGEKPPAVIPGKWLVVLVEIGDIRKGRRKPVFVWRTQTCARSFLQIAKTSAESQLLIVRKRLTAKNQHGVGVHS